MSTILACTITGAVSSFPGDFQSAVSHCQNSCEAVGVVYGSNSVEVAQEKEKLSQLLFHK